MKLPNGAGSVTKLSGNRRKPYLARATVGWELNEEEGTVKQKRVTVGTFATKKDALQALIEFTTNPYDIESNNITMQELFDRWHTEHSKSISARTARAHVSSWDYCSDIYNMRVRDVRPRHLKGMLKNATAIRNDQTIKATAGSQSKIKALLNLLFDYAVEYELTDKNYSRAFSLPKDVAEKSQQHRSHIAFTNEEMEILWNSVDTYRFIDWILIQCYMGWRPQELILLTVSNTDLSNQLITGGMKTGAGRNRTVPIHPKIADFVERNYRNAIAHNSEFLFIDPDARDQNMKITYDRYAGRFGSIISALGLNPEHRPHDPRKTFITMAKRAGVDEYILKRIIGHTIRDVTESVYTERGVDWIREELLKIP